MTTQEIKFKNLSQNYSIIIGENILNKLNKKLIYFVRKLKKSHLLLTKMYLINLKKI